MSVGMNRETGRLLLGIEHVRQSIITILTTEFRSRVQRRDYGSRVPQLIDAPQNEETLVDFYMAVAEALDPRMVKGAWYGEPRVNLSQIGLDADEPGTVQIRLVGTYFPRGHKGDFSRAAPTTIEVPAAVVQVSIGAL